MNLNAEFVYSCIVLNISVQPVRLLDQDRAAYTRMLLQVAKHVAEVGPPALLGRLHIRELVGNHKPFACGVLAQKAKLCRDAEALLLLILAGHSRVEHNDGMSGLPVPSCWNHS